jgi:hypothetical protein
LDQGNGDTWPVDYVITQSANVSVGSEHGWQNLYL